MISDSSSKLHDFLFSEGMTFSCAESCTGGLVSKSLTDHAGSSSYFLGSVVSYSNDVKSGVLGVRKEIIEANGAVSEQTAIAMAEGVKSLMGSDVSLSITGIAGPDGGTPQKPVGTVFMAFCVGQDILVKRFQFVGNREKIRSEAAKEAMSTMLSFLESKQAKV